MPFDLPAPALPHAFGHPPRPVRRRRGWSALLFLRAIAAPLSVIILGGLAFSAGVACWGEVVEATITGVRTTTFSNGRETHFARYRYEHAGRTIDDEQRMEGQRMFELRPGQRVRARTAAVLGLRYTTLADGFAAWLDHYAMPVSMALVLLFIGWSIVIYRGFVLPAREKWLLREGALAVASIIELPLGPQRSIVYGYEAEGEPYQSSLSLTTRPRRTAAEPKAGDPLTIFYDPLHPARHVVYDYCDHEIPPPRA